MPERDPHSQDPSLDALRAAWRALEAPEATPEAEDADAATRASVDWMRAAWSAVEPPATLLSARLLWRSRMRAARRNAPIVAAAAALVVIALTVWATTPPRLPQPERVALGPDEPAIAAGTEDVAQSADAGPSSEPRGSGDRASATAPKREPAPTVVASAPEPNAIVLEHGSVRLVLVDANEVTTTIEHELESSSAASPETAAPPALPVSPTLPEEATR